MKVNLVKDGHGKVVATFEDPQPGGPQLRPALKHGHTVHAVEAPEDYRRNIKAFYAQHSSR